MPRKKVVPLDSTVEPSNAVIDSLNETEHDKVGSNSEKPPVKKRGRRPKGGKIITTEKHMNIPVIVMQENIILHLRCSLHDIHESSSKDDSMTNMTYNPEIENVKAYSSPNIFGNIAQSSTLNYHELNLGPMTTNDESNNNNNNQPHHDIDNNQSHHDIDNDNNHMNEMNNIDNVNTVFENIDITTTNQENDIIGGISHEKTMLIINTKLQHLSKELYSDDIRHKNSACFWCTYDFDSEVVHIPKYNMNGTYHVYGCFCSPQCATAHLMSEKVDSSIKFERYQLINNLYAGIYNYKNSIKPAPNPYYVLEKYYGSLTINEYRDLMNTNRHMVVIDKPMTHIFPELYEDNDDFIVSKRTIPKNNDVYSVRKSSASKK